MRAVLAFPVCPRHCVGGMGQAGQGVGSVELQAAHQPHRPHRVSSSSLYPGARLIEVTTLLILVFVWAFYAIYESSQLLKAFFFILGLLVGLPACLCVNGIVSYALLVGAGT